jgi:hypothetical protein
MSWEYGQLSLVDPGLLTGLIVGSGGLQLSHKRDVEGRARQFS